MKSVLLTALLQAALAALHAADAPKPAGKPNILYIMADDHPAAAIGAYGRRLPDVSPTPNLEKPPYWFPEGAAIWAAESIERSRCQISDDKGLGRALE